MLKHILPLIPKHKIYVEPFLGGGAVYWAKEPSEVEVINDTNREVINFYDVARKDSKSLREEVFATLHSREQFRQAKVVYSNPELFTPLKRAWAFWTLSCQSYSSSLGCGWRHVKGKKVVRDTNARKRNFTQDIEARLINTQIECNDALKVIRTWDDPETFFYADPPYFNANMGHYDGYTLQNFTDLLETLSHIRGKFLLSSYPSEVLDKFISTYGWSKYEIHKNLGMRRTENRKKIEVLTANYDLRNSSDTDCLY